MKSLDHCQSFFNYVRQSPVYKYISAAPYFDLLEVFA